MINLQKIGLKPLTWAIFALSCGSVPLVYANSNLSVMTDEQMSETTGQALMSLSYISPTDSANLQSKNAPGSNIGFYKLGMEAELELNANIKKLQLGCGGVNGAGACDIDIDNLSISGQGATSAERASSSAKLTNPFLEFAIRNPQSASTREVVGLRVSSEKAQGLLTVGTNNDQPNGINTLSGYMVVDGYGNATTKEGTFGLKPGETVNTTADIGILLCTSGCGSNQGLTAGYGAGSSGSNKGIKIPSMVAPFTVNNAVVSGNRLTSANVNASALIPDIPINQNSGQLGASLNQQACVALFICVQNTFIKLNTTVTGLKADINFSEDLGYIHNLPINSSVYLALQQQALQWPGAKEVALKGWWLSMQDPVNLGDITPTDQIDISSVYGQFATILGQKLQEPAYKISVNTGDGLQALFGSGITKTVSPVNLSDRSVSIGLKDLKLSTQNVVPNCYGSLKFC